MGVVAGVILSKGGLQLQIKYFVLCVLISSEYPIYFTFHDSVLY